MKKMTSWCSLAGAAIVSVMLSACGSSSDSSDVTLRVANATTSHPSLQLLVGGTSQISGVTLDTVSSTVSTASGTISLQVNDTGSGTALITTQPSLTNGLHYLLVAYESGGSVRTALINEDFTVGATGATNLRIVNLAFADAGKLDVYIVSTACTAANLTGVSPTGSFTSASATTLSQSQGNGTFNLCVTGNGSKSDIRLSLPITLTGAQAASVLLTPAAGGSLLNGSFTIQQGTYAATRNTNARVRLAAAVSSSASVATISSSGVVVDPGSAAPSFGFYTLVPATDSLNVTVNGSSVGLSAGALTAGSDFTLVVYGAPGASTASLIADNNRAPTDATTAKVRFINGLPAAAGSVTLTAGSVPIGINVAGGGASDYAAITPSASTATALQLTSSVNGAYTVDTTNTLTANTTYTVLAAGTATAPRLLVR